MVLKSFGERVKKELKDQNKRQKDLCKVLFVSKSTLSQWLNNKNKPPMQAIVDIAVFLDVSTDYLLGLKDEQ